MTERSFVTRWRCFTHNKCPECGSPQVPYPDDRWPYCAECDIDETQITEQQPPQPIPSPLNK